MHPAISVIFFTVMSGAGYGLLAVISLSEPLGFTMSDNPVSVFIISAVGVGLAVAGLLASAFHLGRPMNAWRAFSQWRTSWLSREANCAVMTLVFYGIYALYWMILGERLLWFGLLAGLGSIFTVFTTSMIYAQMRTIPHWNTALTPLIYLLFSFSTGFLLAAGLSLGLERSNGSEVVSMIAAISLLAAWAAKILWWQRAKLSSFKNPDAALSSVASATGLGKIGAVRLLERPHTGENYLTKEMVHVIGRKHADRLRLIAMTIGGLVPFAIVLLNYLGYLDQTFLIVAAVIMIIGLFAERWLFFAEAEHSVSLYY